MAEAVAFTVEAAGVAFTAEVVAAVSRWRRRGTAGSMAAGVVSVAEVAEDFTPVAEDIVVAAPTGARGLSVAARDLLAEGATTEAEAFAADQRRDVTERAGDRTAGYGSSRGMTGESRGFASGRNSGSFGNRSFEIVRPESFVEFSFRDQ